MSGLYFSDDQGKFASGYRRVNPIKIKKDSALLEGVLEIFGNGPEVDWKNPIPHLHAGEQVAPLLVAQNNAHPSENQMLLNHVRVYSPPLAA